MEHPVLISPCGFLLLEPASARGRQLREYRHPQTGLTALWSGATRRCRHCSSENNAAAPFVPVIRNLLRTVNKSQALSVYWRITKHSGVPPLTLLQRFVAFVIQAPTAELMSKEWHEWTVKTCAYPKDGENSVLGPPLICSVLLVFWLEAV